MFKALFAILPLALLILSCGSKTEDTGIVEKSSPSEIVETAYAHLINKEYREYMLCVQKYDSIPERYRNSLINVLKQAAENEQKERKGMVGAKTIEENTNPAGDYSVVRVDITYGDSTREEIAVPVVRFNGKWRLK